MNTKWQIVISGTVFALLLSACETEPKMELREGYGNAVRTNMALQVINPDAGKAEPVATTLDGRKAEGGLERYYGDTGEAEEAKLIEGVGD